MAKKGSLSINSENIFPIIKKWLYSDHDIFYRELVSNGCDAITKLKKLSIMGEYEEPDQPDYKITVSVNQELKTITISDNGLGMTEEEVDEYINQIAFSGAADFLEKYKDKTNEDQIIGHFGLGFYSAFMVADRVTIDTLSYKKDAKPVHWDCTGGTDFEMSEGNKDTHGTTIVLYLNEDSYEFSNEYRAKEVLEKYCSFMPVSIFLINENAPVEETKEETKSESATTEEASETSTDDASSEDHKEAETKKAEVKPLNETHPLWTKHPNDCTEEEYRDFYHKVFHDYKEPLFWIHLNMDYPFNLKGILYFPKINSQYESIEGTIKLYNNQVFVADNIKEVIPEFLMLLKGVIDCPDLPLNVSRSALQNDGFVKKISDYITKKVADKLTGMFKTDRENYEKYWDDINPFIKYGCLRDEKFEEKVKEALIFKDLSNKYISMQDALEENKEAHPNTIFYVTNETEQAQYIQMFQKEGLNAVLMNTTIDAPFINALEAKNQDVKFVRIDADLASVFKDEALSEDEKKDAEEKLSKTFADALGNDSIKVSVEKLKDESISSMLLVNEQSRRMMDMMKSYGMNTMDPSMFGGNGEQLVLNANNTLVQYLLEHTEGETTQMLCKQLYDLAVLGCHPLTAEQMTAFIARSNEILQLLVK
ncbi:MAG: molecular chaperone HtpG [Lachnospiraceae bacterium]|nr:molecular chaperone HtpG [Lachnospiraceae bacterium]